MLLVFALFSNLTNNKNSLCYIARIYGVFWVFFFCSISCWVVSGRGHRVVVTPYDLCLFAVYFDAALVTHVT